MSAGSQQPCAEAVVIAGQRLRIHLRNVAELAARGNIPAALMVVSDVVSDLDEIQRLIDAED
jgi:hypothetical protein